MALPCQEEYKRWRYRKEEGIQPDGCEENTTELSLWGTIELLKPLEMLVSVMNRNRCGPTVQQGQRKIVSLLCTY